MRRRICALVPVFAGLLICAPGAGATLRSQYLTLHKRATAEYGPSIVGREIVSHGMPAKRKVHLPRDRGVVVVADSRPATRREISASIALMQRWLAPPPPVSQPTSVQQQSQDTPTQAVSSSSPSSSGGGGCSGMSAESGSAGYGAYNPAGGYIGCYQIAPGHYGRGGSCSGLGTDPAGQDACAQIICQTEGPGAWTNSAGQNPCGRP